MQSIGVKHNIEVAHRLFELPGKCEQIHGHSMWITMELFGDVNSHGILAGIEYGDLKKVFRNYLDGTYDHRLLLNASDPFAHPLFQMERNEEGEFTPQSQQIYLPGLQAVTGDPTTENIARWVGEDMRRDLHDAGMINSNLVHMRVQVFETKVNYATWEGGIDGTSTE